MRTILFALAICISTIAIWLALAVRSAESVYLEMVELNAWKAQVIELPISPEIKQRDLIYVDDKLEVLDSQFQSSQYTDAKRFKVLQRHLAKMEKAKADIDSAMKRMSRGLSPTQ